MLISAVQTKHPMSENHFMEKASVRQTLNAEYFLNIRKRTEFLCSGLSEEDQMLQADYFVSPPKWHLAHTTWFFEEMILKPTVSEYREYDTQFPLLFNSYYETIGKRIARHQRHLISRPSLEEVNAYRKHVNASVCTVLNSGAEPEVVELIRLGLQHEQQHQELLATDIKYSLFHNPTYPSVTKEIDLVHQKNASNGWMHIPEGVYEIGHKGEGFCFDNELGIHRVFAEPFDISASLVTNGEFLEFIEDGGYEKFQFWHDEGWAWVKQNNLRAPLYWKQEETGWKQYTLQGMHSINPKDILAHVSYFEAAAFAQWKGMRLPTEFEWEIASEQLHWGQRWEWTNSAYLPYPGFKTSEGAVGEYNGKFMINQMVLRGASVATSPGHSRKTYRNFFPTDARWQCTGIRLAK